MFDKVLRGKGGDRKVGVGYIHTYVTELPCVFDKVKVLKEKGGDLKVGVGYTRM